MSKYQHRKQRIHQLITLLAGGMELPAALVQCNLSPARARQMLTSDLAIQELRRFRKLRETQRALILHNAGPDALQALTRILYSEKPDALLKGAQDILRRTEDECIPLEELVLDDDENEEKNLAFIRKCLNPQPAA